MTSTRAFPIGTTDTVTYPTFRAGDLNNFETLFLEKGVISGLAVSQRGAGANMSVDVSAGQALVDLANTLLTPNETYNLFGSTDGVTNLAVPTADATNPRIDRVIARMNVVLPNASSSNVFEIAYLTGTPAGSPSAPALPSNAITLATVAVAAGATSVVTANITDGRTYVTLDTAVLADVIRAANLASTATGKGASLVGVEDTASHFAGTNVETVLAELFNAIPTTTSDNYGTGADGALNVTSGTTTIDCAGASVVIKNYTSFNVSAGATLAFSNVPDAGLLFIPLVQGNTTIAGTIDLSGKGSKGGVGVTVSRTSNGDSPLNGNDATLPTNSLQQLRYGRAGLGIAATSAGVFVNASGGSSGANLTTDGTASSSAGSAGTVAGGASAPPSITQSILEVISTGMRVGPGAGGGSGGVGATASGYASGTFTATSGDGGYGGGGLFIACGGTFTFTGTINMSGANASAPSKVFGSGTKCAVAAGGSAGGAAGTGMAIAKTIGTVSGTVTATGGTKSSGTTQGVGSPDQNNASDGTDGPSGSFIVVQSF